MGRLSSVYVCVRACVCSERVCAPLDVGMSTLQRPVKRCLNEVPVQQWWVVFDGHVICLFSPNGLFSWLREGERGERETRREGRADRFTPSPLLAPPMSHLILLLTAKSTPLTHSELVRTTTADCLPLHLTVCLGGISFFLTKFLFKYPYWYRKAVRNKCHFT